MRNTRLERMQALRRQALELIARGAAHSEIAAELGVSRAVVWKWSKQTTAAGSATKHAYTLNSAVLAELPAVIERGAQAYGFANDDWTNARIAVMFEIEFGMRLTSILAFHLVSELIAGPVIVPPVPGMGTGAIACRRYYEARLASELPGSVAGSAAYIDWSAKASR